MGITPGSFGSGVHDREDLGALVRTAVAVESFSFTTGWRSTPGGALAASASLGNPRLGALGEYGWSFGLPNVARVPVW